MYSDSYTVAFWFWSTLQYDKFLLVLWWHKKYIVLRAHPCCFHKTIVRLPLNFIYWEKSWNHKTLWLTHFFQYRLISWCCSAINTPESLPNLSIHVIYIPWIPHYKYITNTNTDLGKNLHTWTSYKNRESANFNFPYTQKQLNIKQDMPISNYGSYKT